MFISIADFKEILSLVSETRRFCPRDVLFQSNCPDIKILDTLISKSVQASHIPIISYTLSSFQLSWNILGDVLQGLQCLHLAGLVHGAVHPNNVFVDVDERAILSELGFSKCLVCVLELVKL